MSKRSRLLIMVLLLAVILVAGSVVMYSLGPRTITYPPLGSVTRIEIKTGSDDKQVRVIDDPEEIRRVIDFVDSHLRGWGGWADWAGVPVPQVSASFYNGSQFKGHFGVGPGFFECQREGTFASKACSGPEELDFLKLVGLQRYEFAR
jgi:hypothetical protein